MTNLGRRRGDGLTYQRGQGPVNEELLAIQICLESLHPEVVDQGKRINDLESSRDKAWGLLKVIAALNVLTIGLIIAAFTWGLNHATFHSDWEKPQYHSENAPQSATQ